MIALVDDRVMRPVCDALAAAGARRAIVTQIGGTQD